MEFLVYIEMPSQKKKKEEDRRNERRRKARKKTGIGLRTAYMVKTPRPV